MLDVLLCTLKCPTSLDSSAHCTSVNQAFHVFHQYCVILSNSTLIRLNNKISPRVLLLESITLLIVNWLSCIINIIKEIPRPPLRSCFVFKGPFSWSLTWCWLVRNAIDRRQTSRTEVETFPRRAFHHTEGIKLANTFRFCAYIILSKKAFCLIFIKLRKSGVYRQSGGWWCHRWPKIRSEMWVGGK